MPRNSACTSCALHAGAETVCLWHDGPEQCAILFVGEAPGAQEDKHGRPFIGDAGKVLNSLLSRAGLARAEVAVTNIAKCRPPGNRTPLQAEMDACAGYLIEEIETIKPQVIVALGATAAKALTGKPTIAGARGKVLAPKKGYHFAAQIVVTYHPASVLYERSENEEKIVEDIKFAASLIGTTPATHRRALFHPAMYDAVSLFGGELAVGALDRFSSAEVLTCDLEWTHGGDKMIWPWSNRGEVYTVAVTGRVNGEVLSVGLAWPPPPAVYKRLRELLESKPTVFHNAMSDMLWLYHHDILAKLAADTMFFAHLIDETVPKNLSDVTARFAPDVQQGWKGHTRNTRPASEAEWLELLSYNTDDTYATLRAFEGVVAHLHTMDPTRAANILRVQKHLLVASLPVLLRAGYVGIPVDRAAIGAYEASQQTLQQKAINDLSEATGLPLKQAVQLVRAPKKVKEYIQGSYGLDIENTKADVLQKYAEQYPAIDAILRYRGPDKLLTTYLQPWERMLARQGDDRLHTIYRMVGTRTGRLSSEAEEGGPVHVIPRDPKPADREKEGVPQGLSGMRGLIFAPNGRQIVAADYSQMELRCIAWWAPERNMRAFYKEGLDLHYATAAYLVACSTGPMSIQDFWPRRGEFLAQVTKSVRQTAKPVNFGLAYGMQDEHFREVAEAEYGVKFSAEESRAVRASYFRLFSDLPDWHTRSMREAERLGYTLTAFGRYRTIDRNDLLKAINTPIQSMGSDFALCAMVQVDNAYRQEGLDAKIIGFIHDSIIVDVCDRDADKAAKMLTYHMENVDTSVFNFKIDIPLVAEAHISQRWGEE